MNIESVGASAVRDGVPESSGVSLTVGLGGEGCAVVERLISFGLPEWMETGVIDTDSTFLEKSCATYKLAASSDWVVRSGTGCGGDIIRGERSIARERAAITKMLKGKSLLIVTGGLGGGTCTGGIRTLASVARSEGIPAVFLLTTPFSFESYSRRLNAEECIRELIPACEILLVLPNDLLYCTLPPEIAASEAYAAVVAETAHTVFGISASLHAKNLIGADYADFMNLLKGAKSECAIGVGKASSDEGLDKCALALERAVASPFLGGLPRIERSDAVMIIVTGGNDMTFAEMKRSLELAAGIVPENVEFMVGAGITDSSDSVMRITVIALKFDPAAPQNAAHESKRRVRRPAVSHRKSPEVQSESQSGGVLLQTELEFVSYSRGIFDRFPPVKHHDEDLDIPTFQRRNITIDKGS